MCVTSCRPSTTHAHRRPRILARRSRQSCRCSSRSSTSTRTDTGSSRCMRPPVGRHSNQRLRDLRWNPPSNRLALAAPVNNKHHGRSNPYCPPPAIGFNASASPRRDERPADVDVQGITSRGATLPPDLATVSHGLGKARDDRPRLSAPPERSAAIRTLVSWSCTRKDGSAASGCIRGIGVTPSREAARSHSRGRRPGDRGCRSGPLARFR